GGGERDLLQLVQGGGDEGEEAGAAALETLGVVVDAVERDVERPARQAVDCAVTRGHALLRARRQQHKGQRAAARQRQGLQIFLIHRIGDGGGGRLQDLPFALHFDGLGDGADFHNHSLIGRARRVDDDAFVNGRLEPLLTDGQGVTARRQRRRDKAAVGAGRGGQDGLSVFIL